MFRVEPHQEKPLIWWYENQSKINTSPSYQRRGNIWSKQKKAALIDSVINNYDVPKIYLADFTYANTKLNEAHTPYAVIDGKQRLEAFFAFFSGELVLDKDFVFNDDPYLRLSGMSYPDLRKKFPEIAQRVELFVPSIVSVITDEEDKVDEMFVRLNSGLQVTAAERRNAMRGPIPKLIRKLVLHPFFVQKIAFETKRMQEYNTVAKVLLIQWRGAFTDTKANNLDKFVKENAKARIEEFRDTNETILHVLDLMTTIFKDRDPILNSEGPIPLYYWFIKENVNNRKFVRSFLEKMKDDVKANLAISQRNPDDADAELTSYYTMGRTTNDKGSLSGRLAILQNRFKEFLRTTREV